ncbi:MAG TPA: glycosyltransferase family 39 protein [Steroidobacteraceae bacterium]
MAIPELKAFDRNDYLLILLCSLFLYANLFARAGTPFLLGGDQVFFWMWGQRLLNGEQIYRDFFQFTPPGTDLLYWGAFKLLGARSWVPNLVVLVLGIALCALCLRISKSIMSRGHAALATSLYVVFVFGTTLNGTHHFFSVLAVSCAVAVLLGGSTPSRIAIAGAFLGIATFITQTRGPVVAFAIALWMLWERYRAQKPWSLYLKQLVLLGVSLGITWFVLSGYYVATLGLRQLLFYQIATVREHVVAGWNAQSIGFPGLSRSTLAPLLQWLFAYILLPMVYAACLWRLWKATREKRKDAVWVGLLTAVGSAMFLEVAQSPSWLRFFCVALPGVILFVWLLSGTGKVAVYATRSLWIGVLGLAAFHTWHGHSLNSVTEDLPAGRIAAQPLPAEKLAWLAAHTTPGQYMLQAQWPGMYLPLALRNPLFLDVVAGAGASRSENVDLAIRQLEDKRVQYIVLSPRLQRLDRMPEVFAEFVTSHYRLVRAFADRDEIWERKQE